MTGTMSSVKLGPSEWMVEQEKQIVEHAAWNPNIDAEGAESLLKGKEAFTYVLRKGEDQSTYFITFVSGELTLCHQRFTLEESRRGWMYKNTGQGGGGTGPVTAVVGATLEEIIPQMMHCGPQVCRLVA